MIEAQFTNAPAEMGGGAAQKLDDVTSVQAQAAEHVPHPDQQWLEDHHRTGRAGGEAGVQVKSLSVQNTTLDDVFVHFTGRQLRDEQVKAIQLRHARPSGDAPMNRMWAIVERELRKFFRSPALMLVSMVFPLVQLIVLGNAFGGKIKDARLGVVDQDHGTQAVKVTRGTDAVRGQRAHLRPRTYDSDQQAMEDVRTGTHRRRHHHPAGVFAPRV